MFGFVSLLIIISIGVWVVWGFGNGDPEAQQAKIETYQQAVDMAKDVAKKFDEQIVPK